MSDRSATLADLVALLASVSGQDAHADAFLARLLSLSDYSYFCEK